MPNVFATPLKVGATVSAIYADVKATRVVVIAPTIGGRIDNSELAKAC